MFSKRRVISIAELAYLQGSYEGIDFSDISRDLFGSLTGGDGAGEEFTLQQLQ